MSPEQFIKAIEAYYGPYRDAVRLLVRQYVARFTPAYRAILYAEAVRTLSGQFKFVPDVAALESLRPAAVEELERQEILRKQDLSRKAIAYDEDVQDYREEIASMLSGLAKKLRRGDR